VHPHDCLRNPQVRIPLVMRFPEGKGIRERVVMDTAELVDIAPTVLEYVGLKRQDGMVGESLMGAVLRNEGGVTSQVVAESESMTMLLSGKYKYGNVPTSAGVFEFLYDEGADPMEDANLAGREEATTKKLAAAYGEIAAAARENRTVKPGEGVQLSREEVERLKSVGYLAGGRLP